MDNKELKETTKLCFIVFAKWHKFGAQHDEETHNMIVENSFTAKILTKKFEAFDVGIELPDELLLLLGLFSGENPGLVQTILMDLLQSIKDKKGPIPRGYEITSLDVASAFPFKWPILEDSEIFNEYLSKYDNTIKNKATDNHGNKINACDTKEFWMQVMEA